MCRFLTVMVAGVKVATGSDRETRGNNAQRILLVEDNAMNRDALQRRLTRQGFEVRVAEDGRRCLAEVASFEPHLVLMDLGLPEIDGWECMRRLRADPATRALPIIVLTAHALVGERERALAAGCDDFDTKPIDFARLLGKLQALLQRES